MSSYAPQYSGKNGGGSRYDATRNPHLRRFAVKSSQTIRKDAGSELIQYPQHLHLPKEYVVAKMSEFFKEDLPGGDKTTENIVPDIAQITAEIQALEELVFAGCDVIPHCFGKNCSVSLKKRDGENIFPGEVFCKIIL